MPPPISGGASSHFGRCLLPFREVWKVDFLQVFLLDFSQGISLGLICHIFVCWASLLDPTRAKIESLLPKNGIFRRISCSLDALAHFPLMPASRKFLKKGNFKTRRKVCILCCLPSSPTRTASAWRSSHYVDFKWIESFTLTSVLRRGSKLRFLQNVATPSKFISTPAEVSSMLLK